MYFFLRLKALTLLVKKFKKRSITKKGSSFLILKPLWAHLGSNQGPPDYESGALTD